VHTARSYDARTPPEEVVQFYAARGYDFVAITDHNRVTSWSRPGLLDLGRRAHAELDDLRAQARPGYRCLFHTSGLFVDPASEGARADRLKPPFRPVRREAYESQLQMVRALGAVPVLNHPQFHFAADARMITTLAARGLVLVELFNASLGRQHPAGRASAEQRAEQLWDDVLSAGTLVHALAADDAHHFSDVEARRRAGKRLRGDRACHGARRKPARIARALELVVFASTGVTLAELERGPRSLRCIQPRRGYRIRLSARRRTCFTPLEARSPHELAGQPYARRRGRTNIRKLVARVAQIGRTPVSRRLYELTPLRSLLPLFCPLRPPRASSFL
jgi:hypothetical protein